MRRGLSSRLPLPCPPYVAMETEKPPCLTWLWLACWGGSAPLHSSSAPSLSSLLVHTLYTTLFRELRNLLIPGQGKGANWCVCWDVGVRFYQLSCTTNFISTHCAPVVMV